jgi:hypothetical protein
MMSGEARKQRFDCLAEKRAMCFVAGETTDNQRLATTPRHGWFHASGDFSAG